MGPFKTLSEMHPSDGQYLGWIWLQRPRNYKIYCIYFQMPLRQKREMLLPQIENRLWQLYAKALAAKNPEDTDRAVQELRSELDEHPFVGRRSVEVQINNLACLDRAVRITSIASNPERSASVRPPTAYKKARRS
jgi:hypothetical protein